MRSVSQLHVSWHVTCLHEDINVRVSESLPLSFLMLAVAGGGVIFRVHGGRGDHCHSHTCGLCSRLSGNSLGGAASLVHEREHALVIQLSWCCMMLISNVCNSLWQHWLFCLQWTPDLPEAFAVLGYAFYVHPMVSIK
jgi:hypothetical protein